MNIKLMIRFHSVVHVITNSSSEIFSICGDVKVIKEFIHTYITENGLQCSGIGGDIGIQTFRQHINRFISDYENSDEPYFSENYGIEYVVKNLETYEEKFELVLEDFIDNTKKYNNFEINRDDIDNMVILDIDNANQGLIKLLKETFTNYIDLL